MKDSNIKKTENAVMAVYQNQTPSDYQVFSSAKEFKSRENSFRSLLHSRLKFPTRMFEGARVLDLGSGTGQHTIFFTRWGAECDLVEVNSIDANSSRDAFKEHAPLNAAYRVHNVSLFDYVSDLKFDIVFSSGVLHHTGDARKGFEKLASFVKPGGFAILGIGTSSGGFVRNLQRYIGYKFSSSVDELEKVVESLFKENLDRAESIGRRTRKAIIHDGYVNPKIYCPSVAEVLGWFAENQLEFYSAWPGIYPSFLADSWLEKSIDLSLNPGIAAASELIWLSKSLDDKAIAREFEERFSSVSDALSGLASLFSDVTPETDIETHEALSRVENLAHALKEFELQGKPYCQVEGFLTEVANVLRAAQSEDFEVLVRTVNNCRQLFRGPNGVGMNYFIAHRPS